MRVVFSLVIYLGLGNPVIAACINPSSLDLTQTVFLFDFFSNSTSDTSGTERQLADYEYSVIVDGNSGSPFKGFVAPGILRTIGCKLIGQDWRLVWGPSVYELPGSDLKADNTAFVVYSPSQDTYVLAIAGTNPTAALDWINEDFEVGPTEMVDWPYNANTPPVRVSAAARPQISLGTAKGIYYVLNLGTQATQSPSPNQKLSEFLNQLNGSVNTRLIVTGHSLGGALAPTIAFWAKNNMNLNWQGQIYALPTAGPSPGNAFFAHDWDLRFQSAPVSVNSGNQIASLNTPVFNQWDLVPHAWSLIFRQNAQASDGFYFWDWNFVPLHPPVPPTYTANTQIGSLEWTVTGLSTAFLSAVDLFTIKGQLAGMEQSDHRQEILGAWPVNVIENNVVCPYGGPGPSPITSVYKFLESLGVLHIWSYYSAFGLGADTMLSIKPINISKPQSCSATPIPSLSEWSQIILGVSLMMLLGWKLRRYRAL